MEGRTRVSDLSGVRAPPGGHSTVSVPKPPTVRDGDVYTEFTAHVSKCVHVNKSRMMKPHPNNRFDLQTLQQQTKVIKEKNQ